MTITREQIARLRELHEKATNGPWNNSRAHADAVIRCSVYDILRDLLDAAEERDRLREKLQRQQERHLDAMHGQDAEADGLYAELLMDWEAADRYAARWKALAKRMRTQRDGACATLDSVADAAYERRGERDAVRAELATVTEERDRLRDALRKTEQRELKVTEDRQAVVEMWARTRAELDTTRAELAKVQGERDAAVSERSGAYSAGYVKGYEAGKNAALDAVGEKALDAVKLTEKDIENGKRDVDWEGE